MRQRPRETKVANLELVVLWVDEQVLGLDVSVDHIVLVTKGYSLDDLVDEISETLGVDSYSVVFKDLKQVLFNILKNQVEATLSFEGFLQEDDILVLEEPQHFDFSHDCFFGNFVFVRFFEFLYGHYRIERELLY